MAIEVVVGTNWGDEGKGKTVDYLAQNADVVVRYQGGNNAGHTVVNQFGTFKLHLVPCGIFNPNAANVLGPGMLIDLEALVSEMTNLRSRGITNSNIKISDRATICFPFHRDEDAWEEERLGQARAFGSTRMGIAPGYSDRYLKKGIQVGELFYPDHLQDRLAQIVEWKNLVARGVYGKQAGISFDEAWNWVATFGQQIEHMVCNTSEYLEEAARGGKRILFEAQLGALRDIYFGIYPYPTSSCTLAAFAPVGGGLFGRIPDRVVGVMKAFSTCVGEGPFVTEMDDAEASALRETSEEYGASTGRPRRIGHFDAVASRYGVRLQGTTEIVLTKLDSLTGRDSLLICTHYEIKGEKIAHFPLNPALEIARPIYKEMKGWTEDISSVRSLDQLPTAAREYVLEIERLVECPIRFISVGPERDATIDRATG